MFITRINRLHDSVRFRLAEWGLAVILFGWGWILLLPGETFVNPALAGLLKIAPEWLWGIVTFALGTTRIIILVINGAWRRTSHARAISALLSCFVWAQIVIGLIAISPVSTGLAVYPAFLLMDIYIVFRAAADARDVDEAWRHGKS